MDNIHDIVGYIHFILHIKRYLDDIENIKGCKDVTFNKYTKTL